MRLFSYDPRKFKQVLAGEFDYYTNTFIKKVNRSHYMVKEKGYGISEDVIQQLIQLNCEVIKIKTKKNLYEFDFDTLLNQSIKNYGNGDQRFIKI